MAVCWVKPGWCNYETTLSSTPKDAETMVLSIDSPCPHIQKFADSVTEIRFRDEVQKPLLLTQTYNAATRWIPCVGCPVPAAILKLAEVEAGAHPEADTIIKFLHFHESAKP